MEPNINNSVDPNSYQQFGTQYGQQPSVHNAPMPNQLTGGKKRNSNSAQNSLQIAEIRDGIVIMKDGSFRSVVMVKAINFDLMSSEERESVEFAYQGFLNSLYFPIQIFIHSEKIDIKPYLDLLQKIRTNQDNMLLGLLMDDYIEYMFALSQQTNIMDKQFYVVVPYAPNDELKPNISSSKNFFTGLVDIFSNTNTKVVINEAALAKAKDELRNRVQALLSGLQQSSIQGIPLDTQELIELYYNTYNPDTAVRQQLKDFDDLSTPMVTKGDNNASNQNVNSGAIG
jgi:type IV secretory pathway VirB4 component